MARLHGRIVAVNIVIVLIIQQVGQHGHVQHLVGGILVAGCWVVTVAQKHDAIFHYLDDGGIGGVHTAHSPLANFAESCLLCR